MKYTRPGKQTMRMNAVAFAHFLSRLAKGDASRDHLAQASGLHFHTVSNYIRALQRIKKPKVIYISDYATDNRGRATIALFSLGDEPDVKKPRKPLWQVRLDYAEKLKQRELLAWASAKNAARTPEERKKKPIPDEDITRPDCESPTRDRIGVLRDT